MSGMFVALQVLTNHGQDLQPQKTKKHVEFPSVMEKNLLNFKRTQN